MRTREEANHALFLTYSANVTQLVGGAACAPAAGQVAWCPTTGNTASAPVTAGGGWSASISNANLQNPTVSCSVYVNEPADPSTEERRVGKEWRSRWAP